MSFSGQPFFFFSFLKRVRPPQRIQSAYFKSRRQSKKLYNEKAIKTKKLFLINLFIIIIIMSRRLRGYPWPSLAISPYHSSPPAGLQGYIPCPHIAAVCKFVLIVPLLHIHVWGSTGVHRLWARPCFSSSVLCVWIKNSDNIWCNFTSFFMSLPIVPLNQFATVNFVFIIVTNYWFIDFDRCQLTIRAKLKVF